MEIKVAESWSHSELIDALVRQLIGQYLRAREDRHGVLLIVHQRQRGPVRAAAERLARTGGQLGRRSRRARALNTPDETNDNIVAYWVPAPLPQKGKPLELSYRLHWQGSETQRPPGAWVTQTLVGRGYAKLASDEQQLVVDFTGPSLAALPADAPVRAVVTAPSNGEILESNAYQVEATGMWRMTVRVRQLKPNEPTELRRFLQNGTNVLTETWNNLLPAQ